MNLSKIPLLEPAGPGRPGQPLARAVETALSILGRHGQLTVLVNDPQRHTDSQAVLSSIIKLRGPEKIRVLVATGSHRFSREAKDAFNREIAVAIPACPVDWHDCRSPELVGISGGWTGHPWLADGPVLAVGSVEPHYFAGFTGAHKTCTIGCASFGDIQSNHAATLDSSSRPCELDGNPVHRGITGMLRALESATPVAAVNLLQAQTCVLDSAGGGPLEALTQLVPAAKAAFVRSIPAPADAIILDVAGPLGMSFYQADKGIKNNEHAVHDGGCIVLAAPCAEGIGQDEFMDLLGQAGDHESAMEIVNRRGYRLGDHKAVRLRRLTDPRSRAVRVFVVSEGLTEQDALLLGMTKSADVAEAFRAGGVDPSRHAVYRVRDAGNLCVMPAGFDTPPPDR